MLPLQTQATKKGKEQFGFIREENEREIIRERERERERKGQGQRKTQREEKSLRVPGGNKNGS